MIEMLVARWVDVPPDHPVIVVGSIGLCGVTVLFMQVVAKLF